MVICFQMFSFTVLHGNPSFILTPQEQFRLFVYEIIQPVMNHSKNDEGVRLRNIIITSLPDYITVIKAPKGHLK